MIKFYLSERTKKCQVNGVASSGRSVKCGIPQGCILGPLFFLLYINDLPECLTKTIRRLFSDDTNLTLTKIFTKKCEVTKYDLRNSSISLHLPQPRTNKIQKIFMYDGAVL